MIPWDIMIAMLFLEAIAVSGLTFVLRGHAYRRRAFARAERERLAQVELVRQQERLAFTQLLDRVYSRAPGEYAAGSAYLTMQICEALQQRERTERVP